MDELHTPSEWEIQCLATIEASVIIKTVDDSILLYNIRQPLEAEMTDEMEHGTETLVVVMTELKGGKETRRASSRVLHQRSAPLRYRGTSCKAGKQHWCIKPRISVTVRRN
jgi:hypothetical protein